MMNLGSIRKNFLFLYVHSYKSHEDEKKIILQKKKKLRKKYSFPQVMRKTQNGKWMHKGSFFSIENFNLFCEKLCKWQVIG